MIVESLHKFSQLAGELVSDFRAPPETPKDRAAFVEACFDLLGKLRDLAWDIRKDLKNPERLREIPGREEAREKIQSLLNHFEKVFETQLVALKYVPNAAEGAETDDGWWKRFTFHVYVEPLSGSSSRSLEGIAQAMSRELAPLERFEEVLKGVQTWLDGFPFPAQPTAASKSLSSCVFRREGEMWRLAFAGKEVFLKDSKGLAYIAELLRQPHKEMAVLELTGAPDEHSIPAEDPEAVKKLKREISDLKYQRNEAEEQDSVHTSQLDERIAKLEEEYWRLTGLGGRIRELDGSTERIRKAVGKCVQEALEKVQESHKPLWRHLDAAIRTGTTCAYRPETPIQWEF
jgi:hypothetical protein